MNPPDPLEERLARLKPSQPSAPFMERLIAARPSASHAQRNNFALLFALLRHVWIPAAAGFAVIAFLFFHHHEQPREKIAAAHPADGSQVYFPSQIDNLLLDANDLGIVRDEKGRAYQLVNCAWLNREIYREQSGDSQLQVLETSRQIIPIAVETY